MIREFISSRSANTSLDGSLNLFSRLRNSYSYFQVINRNFFFLFKWHRIIVDRAVIARRTPHLRPVFCTVLHFPRKQKFYTRSKFQASRKITQSYSWNFHCIKVSSSCVDEKQLEAKPVFSFDEATTSKCADFTHTLTTEFLVFFSISWACAFFKIHIRIRFKRMRSWVKTTIVLQLSMRDLWQKNRWNCRSYTWFPKAYLPICHFSHAFSRMKRRCNQQSDGSMY